MKFVKALTCALMGVSMAAAGDLYFDANLHFYDSCRNEAIRADRCAFNDADNHVYCTYYKPGENAFQISIPVTPKNYCNTRGMGSFSSAYVSKFENGRWVPTQTLFTRPCGQSKGNVNGTHRFNLSGNGCELTLEYNSASTF